MDGNKSTRTDTLMEQLLKVKRGHRGVYLFVALCVILTAATFGFNDRFGALFVYGMMGALLLIFIVAMAMGIKAERIVRSIVAGR